jgi:hypothetical protein
MSHQMSLTSLPDDQRASASQTDLAIDLLSARIPLTLLLDLASVVDSREIYAREPGTADWLPAIAS